MHLRKHNLLLLGYILLAGPLFAQVNSRDPGLSPDFQTTLDEEVNNERVAKAVPVSEPTPPAATTPAAPTVYSAPRP